MQDVLDYNGPDLPEVFNLTFEVTRDVFGELKAVPLKENGDQIAVTQENKWVLEIIRGDLMKTDCGLTWKVHPSPTFFAWKILN